MSIPLGFSNDHFSVLGKYIQQYWRLWLHGEKKTPQAGAFAKPAAGLCRFQAVCLRRDVRIKNLQ